jgi:hypothetical protein
MPVHSQTIAQRPRVSVKVNSRAFDWFDHICRWFRTPSYRSLDNKPLGFYGSWDAKREQFHAMKADAAIDLIAAQNGVSWSSQIYGMSL